MVAFPSEVTNFRIIIMITIIIIIWKVLAAIQNSPKTTLLD